MSEKTRVPQESPTSVTEKLLAPTQSTAVPLRLAVVTGTDLGKSIELKGGRYRVGKDESCELVVVDGSVSREHLMIEVTAAGVQLTDLGSTNGSFCDNVRFDRVSAQSGAIIRLGRVMLKLLPAFVGYGRSELSQSTSFGGMLGKSVAMRQLFALAERVSVTDAAVLITGETGTGKEVCARAIHDASPRAKGPLLVADLSTVTASLIESELFGHRKGALTGAVADRVGLIEQGHKGTLFFDEVAELPLELQPRLLRALERKEVRPLGSSDFKTIDFRIIAATHRDLKAEVKAGRFREDLYHRLFTVQLVLPPLRERREDLDLLIDSFTRKQGKSPSLIGPELRAALSAYHFPGNVRELKNLVERMLALGSMAELPSLETLAPNQRAPGAEKGPSHRPFKESKNELVDDFERRYLDDLLVRFSGNVTAAAKEAGLDRVYLHRLVRKHGLGKDESEDE